MHIACREGYDAVVIKLLSEQPDLRSLKGLALLQDCLIAAIRGRQKTVVARVLEHMPIGPISFLSKPPAGSTRFRRYSDTKDVLDVALGVAAETNWNWAVLLFLKRGARASSPQALKGLDAAASLGDEEMVRVLSKQVGWLKRQKLLDALNTAVKSGHEGTVKILLSRGVKIPQQSRYAGPIHWAAQEGHEDTLRLLLSKGAEDYYVNYPPIYRLHGDYVYSPFRGDRVDSQHFSSTIEFHNWCCLHFAIYNGHYKLVKFLLENDIRPRDRPECIPKALPLAALRGHTEIVELLLASGFNLSATMVRKSALELAARFGHANTVKLLVDAGVQLSKYDLLNAAASGSVPAVSFLLSRGADVNATGTFGQSPLHAAVLNGHPEVVHLLLESGADTEATDCDIPKVLNCAISGNNWKCVRLLLEYGASKRSALVCAIRARNPQLIPELLLYGANVEEEGAEGKTPFHEAASVGSIVALKTLLAAGAQKHARDSKQRTALHHAVSTGGPDAISTLLRWGLDVNARDSSGQTPAHLAGWNKVSRAYDLLVRYGADITIKDNKGTSPADRQDYIFRDLMNR